MYDDVNVTNFLWPWDEISTRAKLETTEAFGTCQIGYIRLCMKYIYIYIFLLLICWYFHSIIRTACNYVSGSIFMYASKIITYFSLRCSAHDFGCLFLFQHLHFSTFTRNAWMFYSNLLLICWYFHSIIRTACNYVSGTIFIHLFSICFADWRA